MADDLEDDIDPLADENGRQQVPLIARPPVESTIPPVALRGIGPLKGAENGPHEEDAENLPLSSSASAPAAPQPIAPPPDASQPTLGASALGADRIAPPSPSSGIAAPSQLTQDQSELQRKQQTGSGISQIARAHPIAGGFLRGLNIAGEIGSALVPQLGLALRAIPGTEEHHNYLIRQDQGRVANDENQEQAAAAAAHAQAETDQAQAAAEKDRAEIAAAGQPKAKEENWKDFPQFTDTDGTPLKIETNSGQVLRVDGKPPTGFQAAKPAVEKQDGTTKITRVVNGVPHEVLVNSRTGEDIKDEGQTKIPGESPDQKRNAAESAQVEREARQNIRKAEGQYRATQQTVAQLNASIDAAKDGNGLLTSFVPTMEVLGINASNGVHRISPAEAQAAGLPGGWAERFNAWFDKASTGKLSPQLQAEGKQLAGILSQSAYQRYKSTYDDESGIVNGYGGTDFGKRVPLIPGEAGGANAGGGKDFGAAPAGKPEGAKGTMPDGTKIVVKGGRLVSQ